MRGSIAAAVIVCTLAADPSSPYDHEWGGYKSEGGELHLDVLREHATKFVQLIVSRAPEEAAQDVRNRFQSKLREQVEALEKLEKTPGADQIKAVRHFVKVAGPATIEKEEYAVDAPLHEVLIRADEILGLEDDPDQDAHPYRKARIIVQTMIKFYKECIAAHEFEVAKDEL